MWLANIICGRKNGENERISRNFWEFRAKPLKLRGLSRLYAAINEFVFGNDYRCLSSRVILSALAVINANLMIRRMDLSHVTATIMEEADFSFFFFF